MRTHTHTSTHTKSYSHTGTHTGTLAHTTLKTMQHLYRFFSSLYIVRIRLCVYVSVCVCIYLVGMCYKMSPECDVVDAVVVVVVAVRFVWRCQCRMPHRFLITVLKCISINCSLECEKERERNRPRERETLMWHACTFSLLAAPLKIHRRCLHRCLCLCRIVLSFSELFARVRIRYRKRCRLFN